MPGQCRAVFDALGNVDFIEGVPATTLPLSCGEAVGELRTVVSQQFDDPDRRGQLESAQRSTLLLSVTSARDGVMSRADRRLVPDLADGSGSYEIAHLEPGRTPMPVTRSIGF